MKRYRVAWIGAIAFIGTILIWSILQTLLFDQQSVILNPYRSLLIIHSVSLLLLIAFNSIKSLSLPFMVVIHSIFLSILFCVSTQILTTNCFHTNPALVLLSVHILLLCLFHFLEFLITAYNQPETVNIDAFLLNKNFEYQMAIVGSLTEFGIEAYFFPEWKFAFRFVILLGLFLAIVGDTIRKSAMITAGHNFHHVIQTEPKPNGQLITSGIYGVFRHPSYVGWFYWTIGNQLLLCNPICMVLFPIISWRFFNNRIKFEEYMLIGFFGDKYFEYKSRVPTGLPFIKGC